MIKVDSVTKIFNEGFENEFCALKDISFSVKKGEFFVLKGISGSGKSTLLSIIAGLYKPSLGTVMVDNEDITRLSLKFLAKFRRENIGLIFQNYNLIPTFSALNNILLPTLPDNGGKKDRALELLKNFNLSAKKDTPARYLSGGEAQRVAIIRALINNPKVILADEPTANLDINLSKNLLLYLKDMQEEGKTIIVTSHDPLILESNLVSSVFELKKSDL